MEKADREPIRWLKYSGRVIWRSVKSTLLVRSILALLLVLAAAGLFGGEWWLASATAFVVLGWLALSVVVLTPYRLWRERDDRVRELEEERIPKLDLVFREGIRPYVQELDLFSDDPAVGTTRERRYRVGIRNRGVVTVPNVRVVLEACTSSGAFVFPYHELAVMDAPPGTGRFSVFSGDEPSVFVDVIAERFGLFFEGSTGEEDIPRSLKNADWRIFFCYKSNLRSDVRLESGSMNLTLRLEGGAVPVSSVFVADRFPDGRLRMRPAPAPEQREDGSE